MTDTQVPPPAPTTASVDRSGSNLPVFGATYRLLLHQQLTRGRLLLAGAMGGLAIFLAVLIARSDQPGEAPNIVEVLSVFGLGLMVPILSLVLASSSLGQLVEDETLVYLWIRPNPRWVLALAAWLASATVAVPMTVLPLTVAAAIGSSGDARVTMAVAAATALASAAYSAAFTLLGLMLRRALIWGLVYVFVWEFFVARVGQGAARLSINTYATSVLAKLTDVSTLPLADRSLGYGIATPILVSVVAIALTAWRLSHTNVA
jgi:ABC-2 type transport system permease protein